MTSPESKERAKDIEDVDKKEKPKLSERQHEYIDNQLEKARKEGVIRREDRMKIYGNMCNLSSSDIKNAESILDEHIGRKRYKRDVYLKGGKNADTKYKKPEDAKDSEIIGLDEAQNEGLISSREKTAFLNNYDSMSGKDRQQEQKKMQLRIEKRKLDMKEFDQILKETPHFSDGGVITQEGQLRLNAYNKPELSEREKLVLKNRLIRETIRLGEFTKLCEKRHNIAGEYYRRGDFESTTRLMQKNITTCARYPQSRELQEQGDKSQRYAHNSGYEQHKNQEIFDKREEVQECFLGKDHDGGLACAQKAVEMSERFLKTTYDGRNGPYQQGSPEIARDDKWPKSYMTGLLQKVKAEEQMAQQAHEKLFKKEQEEDQRILDGEAELIDDVQAEDSTNQALIKAATDTLDGLSNTTEEEDTQEEAAPQTIEGAKVASTTEVTARQEDLEEVTEIENLYTDAESQSGENPEGQNEKQEEGEKMLHHQASQLSEEELGHQKVEIDQLRDGRIQEKDAEHLLRSEAELKMKKKDEELKSKEEIERELSRQLAESGLEKVKKLKRSGKISAEAAQLQEAQLKRSKSGESLGKEILTEHKRTQRTIEVKQQQQTQARLSGFFKKDREQDPGRKQGIDEIRRKSAQKKRDQMKSAA